MFRYNDTLDWMFQSYYILEIISFVICDRIILIIFE